MLRIFLLIMLVCPLCALAQIGQDARRFRGGVAVGINASQVDGDGYGGYKKPNAVAGVWVAQPIGDHFAWRLDIRYIGKGSVEYGKIAGVRHRLYEMHLHYLELPLSVSYQFWNRWSVGAGLSVAYLMFSSERNAYGVIQPRGALAFKRYDIAAQAVAAFRIARHWSLRAEASFTFVPIRSKPHDVISPRRNGQVNRLIQLCVEYDI